MTGRPAVLCRVGWHARTYTDSDGVWAGRRCGVCHTWTTPATGALIELRRADVDARREAPRSRFDQLRADPVAYFAAAEKRARAELAAEREQQGARR